MATAILRPTAAGNYTQWNGVYPALMNHFAAVDEASQNGDTDYIYGSTVATSRDSYTLTSWSPGAVSISQVKVYFWAKRQDTSPQVKPFLRLGGTDNDGTIVSPSVGSYTEYSEVISRPGGGSWQVSDFSTLEVGAIYSNAAKTAGLRVTQIYIEITYTATNFPSPTSLECERQTTPTNASEFPLFSAIFEGDSGGDADQYYVQVSEADDFSTTMWDSGYLDLSAAVAEDARCAEITYDGDDLSSDPPDGVYYWRIKFKRTSDGTVSEWSSSSQFSGIVHPWADHKCTFRRPLPFNRDHGALDTTCTAWFTMKTGTRHVVADNGCFNEAVQASGGFQTEYYEGKDHVVWLSKYDDSELLGVCIRSYDYYTKSWGEITYIDSAHTILDTHTFPTMCIDNDGYIFVSYGCHYDGVYVARSTFSNDSTNWTLKTHMLTGGDYAYPRLVCIPSSNRVYIFYRQSEENDCFIYTANRGVGWMGAYTYVKNADVAGERCYLYGFRFDRKIERLHVAWTDVTSVSKNVSYAYSDYSGANEGFEEWYDVTGVKVGETTDDIMDRNDMTPCILTDDESEYFTSQIVLTKTGEPLIIAQHYYRGDGSDNLTAEERGMICFRYDSGWIGSYLTEDHDVLMRVGRSGTPAIADKNGTIHMFTAVGAVTHKHGIPTADGYHVNYTCSTGSDGYALVDDGIIRFDNADYIYGSGAGEASFTSSETLPANAQPLAVGVECMAKLVGATEGSIRLFVRIGGTDYEGSAQTLDNADRHIRFRDEWLENPSTSAPWTPSEIEAVEFGVKQTESGASWRIGRVTKRAKVHTSVDDEYHAAEIVEFTSTDEGINWNWKWITENSGVGVPMISTKHHLTNNSIGIVYTAGNDVFYLTNEPWGKMLPSGRDLKIFSQGGGIATEIDRIIDTPNMLESTIYFKLPVAVGAGRTAGNRDLIAYYGDANARNDDRPADPNAAWPLNYDSFEELETDSDIEGQAGWNSGSSGWSEIYESPPSHNNKVALGSKCVWIYGSLAYDKTIGSGLTNVCVEGYFWQNASSSSTPMICALDSSSVVFGAGIKDGDGCAGYYSEGSWHSVTAKKSSSFQMLHVKILITAYGCSAWVDGTLIADQVAGITSVDKIRMQGGNNCYFDGIIAYHSFAAKTDATISSGFDDATALWSADHTSTLETNLGTDAYHNIATPNIYKIELKVRARLLVDQASKYVQIHGWVSNSVPYDEDDIEANDTDQIDLVYNTWVSTTLTFDDMTVGDKSVKVDFYGHNLINEYDAEVEIEEIKVYYEIHDPEIEVGDEEIHGWYSTASIRGQGHQQWTSTATIGGWFLKHQIDMPLSSSRQTQNLLDAPVESSSNTSAQHDNPIASGNRVKQYFDQPVESSKTANAPVDLPIESIRATINLVDLPTSSVKRLILQIDNPVSSGILTRADFDAIIGSALRLASTIDLPVESISNSIILLDAPIGSSARTASPITLPVESAGTGSFLIDIAIESAVRSLVSNDLPIEAAQVTAHALDLPVASGCAAAVGVVLPISSAVRSVSLLDLPISSATALTTIIDLPSSSALKMIAGLTFNVSSAVRVLGLTDLPVESISNVIARLDMPVSSAVGMLSYIDNPISSAIRMLANTDLTIESIRRTIHALDLPVSSGLRSWITFDLPVSDAHGVLTEVSLPISSGMVLASLVDLPISAAGRILVTAPFDLPISSIRRTRVPFDLPIGSERRSIIGLTLPVSSGIRSAAAFDLPTSSIRRLLLDVDLPVSSAMTATCANDFPLSSGVRLLNLSDIPISSIGASVIAFDLPVSSGMASSVLFDLPVADTLRVLQVLTLPVSAGMQLVAPVDLPIEASAGVLLSALIDLPISSIKRTIRAVDIPIDSECRTIAGLILPISTAMSLMASEDLPVESGQGAAADVSLPIESGSRAVYLLDMPVSSAARARAYADVIIESICRTVAQLDFPVSSAVIVSGLIDTPICDALRSVAGIDLPVDSAAATISLTDLPIESSAGAIILVPVDLPIEAVKRSVHVVDIPVESERITAAGIILPVSSGVKAIIIADAPVETGMRVVSDTDLPVETNFRMLYSVDLPLESISKMGVTFDLPVESAIGFKAQITLAIESGKGLAAIIDCPVESIARTLAAFDLPIEAFVEMSRLLGINVAAVYIRIPSADIYVRKPTADHQITMASADIEITKPTAKAQIKLAEVDVDQHPKIKR